MLTEISLNVIDIARNSIRAGASLVQISIDVDTRKKTLRLTIADDGSGMSPQQLAKVEDPFFTSRTTRKVGLGIPFLKQEAECTGGTFSIKSEEGKGTVVEALFHRDHIDCMPLGDINSSICMMVTTSENKNVDFVYTYEVDGRSFKLDTREVREILDGVPLSDPKVSEFIRSYLIENQEAVDRGESMEE